MVVELKYKISVTGWKDVERWYSFSSTAGSSCNLSVCERKEGNFMSPN